MDQKGSAAEAVPNSKVCRSRWGGKRGNSPAYFPRKKKYSQNINEVMQNHAITPDNLFVLFAKRYFSRSKLARRPNAYVLYCRTFISN